MSNSQWVTVRAVARGWYRGQRFRPGQTLRILRDSPLEPWMERVDALEPPPEPETLSQVQKAGDQSTTMPELMRSRRAAPKARGKSPRDLEAEAKTTQAAKEAAGAKE